jgi:sensor histidine kinase YesM
MVGLLPIDRLNDVRKDVMVNSFIIAAIGLFIGIWVVIMLTKRLTRQLNVLTNSIDAVAIGDIKQIVTIYSQDDIGQIAIRFNNMTRRISELLQRVVNEEKHKNEAEFQMLEYRYRSLHTQINSHFIYNALETVNAFAKLKGNKEISNVVQLMSRYFRNNTKNITRQFITLQQEFEYLQDYAEIHKYIHGDRLVVRFECSETASDALLPTMILQPVLENALEHGVSAAKEQTLIRLAAEVKNEDRLVITIVDDGLGMSDEVISRIFQPDFPRKDARSGIGLRNVAERLQIIYAGQANISVESGNQGTCVTITLPLNYIAQMPIRID